jgi:hypothetical protein
MNGLLCFSSSPLFCLILPDDLESDESDEAPLSSRKRPRRVDSTGPSKRRKPPTLTQSSWSTCGCGLTDKNASRHRTHTRHLAWLSVSTSSAGSQLESRTPQIGDLRQTSLWGPCILHSESESGWNVTFPDDSTLYYFSMSELGL